jgi:hypothetical protein
MTAYHGRYRQEKQNCLSTKPRVGICKTCGLLWPSFGDCARLVAAQPFLNGIALQHRLNGWCRRNFIVPKLALAGIEQWSSSRDRGASKQALSLPLPPKNV